MQTRRSPLALALAVLLAAPLARAQDAPKPAEPEGPKKGPSTTDPSPQQAGPQSGWMKVHEQIVAANKPGDAELIFVGDSITQGWGGAPDVWADHFGRYKPANLGISGDRTQHVLWRLDHDAVKGLKPRVAVLMIGTNNLSVNTPEEIVVGIKAVVASLRAKLPTTRILLLGVFPRGASADHPARPRIAAINAGIKPLADSDPMITYLDLTPTFLAPDGTIPADVMPDQLHLSPKGYHLWADAMEPTLDALLAKK